MKGETGEVPDKKWCMKREALNLFECWLLSLLTSCNFTGSHFLPISTFSFSHKPGITLSLPFLLNHYKTFIKFPERIILFIYFFAEKTQQLYMIDVKNRQANSKLIYKSEITVWFGAYLVHVKTENAPIVFGTNQCSILLIKSTENISRCQIHKEIVTSYLHYSYHYFCSNSSSNPKSQHQ